MSRPVTQLVQLRSESAPKEAEYFPRSQFAQSVSSSLPVAAEYLPAGQSVQTASPIEDLYFPGGIFEIRD